MSKNSSKQVRSSRVQRVGLHLLWSSPSSLWRLARQPRRVGQTLPVQNRRGRQLDPQLLPNSLQRRERTLRADFVAKVDQLAAYRSMSRVRIECRTRASVISGIDFRISAMKGVGFESRSEQCHPDTPPGLCNKICQKQTLNRYLGSASLQRYGFSNFSPSSQRLEVSHQLISTAITSIHCRWVI